jgi:hypothetical protein
MPYRCTVLRRTGTQVVLDVEPEQPDCEPFYARRDFSLALLIPVERPNSLLERALGGDAVERIAYGAVDPSPYVRDVRVSIVRRGNLRNGREPVARYEVDVTDARWTAHLDVGQTHNSYAWCEDGWPGDTGTVLDDAQVWEAAVPLPVPSFKIGDRVRLRIQREATIGGVFGRGTVDSAGTRGTPPPTWQGGDTLHSITFDHGPCAWVFAESLSYVDRDVYEIARGDVTTFTRSLFAQLPVERLASLEWSNRQVGPYLAFEPTRDRAFPVEVAADCAPWYALLRRLSFDVALDAATYLLDDWLSDAKCLAATEASVGSQSPGCPPRFVCAAPVAHTLGALTVLLSAEPSPPSGPQRAALSAMLSKLPPVLFGYSNWDAVSAYVRAAARGATALTTALPSFIHQGYPVTSASCVGLSGQVVMPGDLDRYRV